MSGSNEMELEQQDAAAEAAEPTEEELQKLAELDEQLAKFEQQRRWSDVIRTMLAKAQVVRDPAQKVELLSQAGRMYLERSSNQAEAIRCFEGVLEHDPHNLEALQRLKELYERRRDWERLVRTMEREAELLDPADRTLRYVEMAQLASQRLRKPDICIELWRKVLDHEPGHPEALAQLATFYDRARQWEPLAEVLEQLVEMDADPAERKKRLTKLGQIYADKLGDDRKAVEAFQRLLDVDPNDRRAQEQIKRRLTSLRDWDALEAFHERTEKWDELIRIFERAADDEEAGLEERVDLLFRAARLWEEKKGRPERAARAYEKVLQLDPENLQAAEALTPIYEKGRDPRKLASVLEVRLGHAADPMERLTLLRELGVLYEEKLRDPQKAYERFLEALRTDPTQQIVREDAERLAEATGSWDPLVQAYREAIDAADPDTATELRMALAEALRRIGRVEEAIEVYGEVADAEPDRRADLVARMAALYVEPLGQLDRAIDLYRELLEEDPGHAQALAALDELYARQERWSDLADHLQRQLDQAEEPERRIDLMVRLAELQAERLGAPEAAIELYREVLADFPEEPRARAALEALLDSSDHQLLAADILEPIYQAGGEGDKLVRVLEIQAARASSPDRRIELLHRIAEIHETLLDQPAEAFEAMARALAEDPASGATREALERLARYLEDGAQRLAAVYEQQAERTEEPQLRAALLAEAARIREEQLEDHEAAIALQRKVAELLPDELAPLEALERLYQLTERYGDLAQVLRAKAKLLPTPEEQKDALYRAAQIYEEMLEQPEEAIAVHGEVLEIDPEDLPALDKRIELFLKLQKWSELLDTYERKADVVEDPEEKKRLLVEVGAVYERELGDVAKAIDSYQRILEIDPEERLALGRLDVLYQASENWPELLSVLERQADLAEEPAEIVGTRYRIAELWRRHLGDPARAVDIYREILTVAPDHEPTLAALEEMIAEGVEVMAAASVLEPVRRAMGDWAKLAAVVEVQVRHEEDPVRRIELLHGLAELYDVQLEQPERAFDAYARALPEDPSDERTIEALESLAERLGAWDRLAALYDQQVEALREEGGDLLVDLALRAARVHEVQTGDIGKAIDRYRVVLDQEPEHPDALEALDRLYEATEQWAPLAEVLERMVPLAASPEDVLRLQFRLGQVLQHRLGQPERAVDAYRDILAAAPEHEEALAALEQVFDAGVRTEEVAETLGPLYRMREDWGKLLVLEEARLAFLEEAEARVEVMHRAAEVAEERAASPEQAFVWMARALLEDPSHDHTLAEVERLATVVGGWAQLADVYARALEATDDEEVAERIAGALARVFEEELEDASGAEQAWRYLLGRNAKHPAALAALDRLYTEHQAWEPLVEVLRRRMEVAEFPDEAADIGYRLADVLENRLERTDEALKVIERVLGEHDPHHGPTIELLELIHTRREDWAALLEMLDRALEVAPSDEAQAAVYAKMARIASERLGQPERAIELWNQVLSLRGEDPEALGALGDLYAAQENWRDLVDVLEREVAAADDDAFRVQVYMDLGRIWWERLQREGNAIEAWERVLDIEPGHFQALAHIAEVHRAARNWTELTDTLVRMSEVGAGLYEDDQLVHVHMQLGYLYLNQLEQPLDAADAYARVLDVAPGHFEAMDALEYIYRAEEMWEEAAQVMERRYQALTDPAARISELLTIADTWERLAEQPDRATSAYERILQIDPLHRHAFERLEALHREQMRWEQLVDLYLGRVEALGEDEGALDTVVDLLLKTAQVYEEELEDVANAYEALKLAWQAALERQDVVERLEEVAARADQWNDLLTEANQMLQVAEDEPTKIAICLACARWYGQKLGHPEYAIPYYQQVLSIDPANAAAMRQMAELYRATRQWDTLRQVLARLVEMSPEPKVKAATEVELGLIAEEQLGNLDEALNHYKRALGLDPENLGAMEALERIHRQQQRWRELAEVLERKASTLEDPDLVREAKLSLGEVYEDRLAEPERAMAAYQAVLDIDPQQLDALKGLERIYAQTERWEDLARVLEAQYELLSTERERISILTRLAAMYEEEFVRPAEAAARLEQVLEIDPTHEEALAGLERLYRKLGQWEKLVETYERHVQVTPERREKVRLEKAMGEVLETQLGDLDRAVDAYLSVLSIDEDDVEALEALSRLYERREEYAEAADILEQLVRRLQDPEKVVELRFRAARLLDEKLGDRVAAMDHYEAALSVDPGHLPSLEALRAIQVDAGDWVAVARLLEQEAEHQPTPRAQARALVELGRVYDQQLDERERAVAAWERALEREPDNEEAALPLVAEYLRQERYEEARPLLQGLFKRMGRRDREEQKRIAQDLGRVALRLGDPEEAARALQKAHELDPSDLDVVMDLADAYYQGEVWDKAHKYYQLLLVHHRDDLDADRRTELFYRLGVIKRELGERRKALNMFDKALEEDPGHRPTLEALIGLYEQARDWEQVIHYKKQLLDVVDSDEERFGLYVEIGDLWNEKVGNKAKAIQAYEEASLLRPEDHRLLHKLLVAYQETRQWDRAIEIIERIAELDDRPQAKAKYAYTVGVILRDELKDPDGALEKFDQALDLDWKQLKAFEAINKILTQKKDWKNLERAFRKMLHRAVGKGDADLEFNLWHNLGVIYRDRQKNFEAAIEAFKMAAGLKPDNQLEHKILAELYTLVPGRTGDAIAEHQWLLRRDPYRVDSYRELYKLYFDARAYDKAWCLAAALVFLGKADREQQNFYEQYAVKGIIRPTTRLGHVHWLKHLFHPDEDPYVAKIMELVAPAVHAAKQAPDKALGLSKKHEVDPQTSTVTFAKTFGFVAQVLNLTLVPRLFLRSDTPGGLAHVPGSNPPAIVCGASLLSGFSPQDLAFVIGRTLTYYRLEHFIRTLLPSHSELKLILLAAMRLANFGAANPQVDATAQQLARFMQPAQVDGLRQVVRKFVESEGKVDIKRWMQAVELTACRAGFLVANDLSVAAKMVQQLPPEGSTDLPPKEKIKELVLFSVSEEYFALREALGIQIKI